MTIKIDNEIYYTVKELKDLLNLTELTIRNYLRSGRLKGCKPGQFWYISKKDLKLFLEGDEKRKRFLGVF